MIGHFLAGIGALIWEPGTDTYLLLRRAAHKDFGAGNWECVTGRVDQGESFEQALLREVREEVGLDVQIEFLVGTTHFHRGADAPENELLGVVYCCTRTYQAAPTLSAEHDAHRWVTAQEALALLRDDRPGEAWLKVIIQRAEFTRSRMDGELRSFHRYNGFDTN